MSVWEIGNGIWHMADCFDAMRTIPDGSVDMILCDLPYGTTQNKWDSVIPFEPLWREYWRVCKPNAAVVLTAQPPFDKMLGASQIRYLKYEWIWEKSLATGHLNAKKQPMKAHENVLVFYREQCFYDPQMTEGRPYRARQGRKSDNYNKAQENYETVSGGQRFPRSVQILDNVKGGFHPTQKPVALFEYLIRTYTQPGETVLDNTAGSGTTAIAAEQSDRRWICIERDPEYSMRALDRIQTHLEAKPCV